MCGVCPPRLGQGAIEQMQADIFNGRFRFKPVHFKAPPVKVPRRSPMLPRRKWRVAWEVSLLSEDDQFRNGTAQLRQICMALLLLPV